MSLMEALAEEIIPGRSVAIERKVWMAQVTAGQPAVAIVFWTPSCTSNRPARRPACSNNAKMSSPEVIGRNLRGSLDGCIGGSAAVEKVP